MENQQYAVVTGTGAGAAAAQPGAVVFYPLTAEAVKAAATAKANTVTAGLLLALLSQGMQPQAAAAAAAGILPQLLDGPLLAQIGGAPAVPSLLANVVAQLKATA